MESIKEDKDHQLYNLLKEYPNPEIREEECYFVDDNFRKVIRKYYICFYKILNYKFLPTNFVENIT